VHNTNSTQYPALPTSGPYTATETINCQGKVIMPGLVNAHTHIPMTLMRGLNDDLRLDVWLGYLMPVEREFVTPEFRQAGGARRLRRDDSLRCDVVRRYVLF
jgi:cytosine/adenosine deaminase-related metal-dependent hydrolase